MQTFDKLTQMRCAEHVKAAVFDWHKANQLFYNGDHFQQGDGWIGPGPSSGEAGYNDLLERLEPVFISQNVIKGHVDRKTNAYIGRTPAWGMALTRAVTDEAPLKDAEKEKIGEADALLTRWWDTRDVHGVLQEMATAYELKGRAGLRLFVPEGELNADGGINAADLQTCLMRLHVECPDAAQMRVVTDRRTMGQVGIYLFSRDEEIEIDGEKTTTPRKCAEITYLDANQKTVLRIIGEEQVRNGQPVPAVPEDGLPLDLGGALWHFEIAGEPLITAPVRSQQKRLNLAQTVSRRNLADNGWLEEFLLNAQLPGHFEGEGEEKRFVADPIERGPGMIRNIKGAEIETDDGTEYAKADVKWRPPVDPQSSIDVANDAKRSIAEETHQLHAFEDVSDNSSGESLKQRRSDFETNLETSVTLMNRAGRWLLETVLAIAVAHSQKPNPYADLRPTFTCRVHTGPRTGLERQEDAARVEVGLMSVETALNEDGVDDVDAEFARIEADGNRDTDTKLKTFEALTRTLDIEVATRVAWYGEDLKTVLQEKGLWNATAESER